MSRAMLAPAAILVCWSLIMLIWMGFARYRAIAAMGASLKIDVPGGRGSDLEGILAPQVMWKAHNHTHLMEQPTIFYAVSAILAIAGAGHADVMIAWGYVALRIVHSLWQATVNRIPVRTALFLLSTVLLGVLAVRAALATLA